MARPPTVPVSSPRTAPENAYESAPITSSRSLRQLSIFFLGATCFLASTAITRRAVYRRNLRLKPKFYEPNTNPHEHFSPMADAMQALNLATMNVFSIGVMLAGGALWSVDISGLSEMQASLRGRLGYDSFDRPPAAVEGSLAEAVDTLRKEEGENHSPRTPR
ncbi:hypothetical protein BDV96DRAFT_651244 [Lophiotrema nucula]|uniref:Altered inheritance of mitochondria protein 11 n=1 Tax=Lophiotrema nucula TaxID=690887 RepID=A0A6A5YSW4_9PLEO|nr:hypothetical protein BDV96DRAFT_651244 [Lophiotrema nucula]